MKTDSRIYVAGHNGLVGSAITRELKLQGYRNLILPARSALNLLVQDETDAFFEREKPDYVFLAAAKVGGIMANNTFRAQFIYENLQIQNNIIHSSWKHGVQKLLFLGSSCIYPKECAQPMTEDCLLASPLEYTNEPYAIAKIAGIKMCESYNIQYGTDFISVMPTNLYGINDNYNLHNSHVLPAMIRKMHLGKLLINNDFESIRNDLEKRPIDGVSENVSNAEIATALEQFGIFKTRENVEIKLWGTGKPRREFLHSDDLAKAVIYAMNRISFNDIVTERGLAEVRNTHINIGSGVDLSIAELAEMIRKITGFGGTISWDSQKPDGTYQKLMDVSLLKKMGWSATIELKEGIEQIYGEY
ncbi:MAG: GDP-L-fucose synthase [Cytophagaceae bacterium]|jgi:GDP-L-fucose synthase|nr:GDP-L-fucose synthase [Cytophagaceae bacterium]